MGTENHAGDDLELLRMSRDGGHGFAVFYRRHRHAVLAFHAQRVAEPERAADLTAETVRCSATGSA
jgi:DNA-directed RNA polymerase specialized sigma24 family protein